MDNNRLLFATAFALVTFCALLNARASYVVLRDRLITHPQRLAQLAFVWLLPILGALFVLGIRHNEQSRSGESYAERNEHDSHQGRAGARSTRKSDSTEAEGSEAGGDGGD